jgi:hypothetical protein
VYIPAGRAFDDVALGALDALAAAGAPAPAAPAPARFVRLPTTQWQTVTPPPATAAPARASQYPPPLVFAPPYVVAPPAPQAYYPPAVKRPGGLANWAMNSGPGFHVLSIALICFCCPVNLLLLGGTLVQLVYTPTVYRRRVVAIAFTSVYLGLSTMVLAIFIAAQLVPSTS